MQGSDNKGPGLETSGAAEETASEAFEPEALEGGELRPANLGGVVGAEDLEGTGGGPTGGGPATLGGVLGTTFVAETGARLAAFEVVLAFGKRAPPPRRCHGGGVDGGFGPTGTPSTATGAAIGVATGR